MSGCGSTERGVPVLGRVRVSDLSAGDHRRSRPRGLPEGWTAVGGRSTIFLRVLAPFTPLPSSAIATRASHYLHVAGVAAPRAGSHTFRHTCVQRLVDADVPFKVIGASSRGPAVNKCHPCSRFTLLPMFPVAPSRCSLETAES